MAAQCRLRRSELLSSQDTQPNADARRTPLRRSARSRIVRTVLAASKPLRRAVLLLKSELGIRCRAVRPGTRDTNPFYIGSPGGGRWLPGGQGMAPGLEDVNDVGRNTEVSISSKAKGSHRWRPRKNRDPARAAFGKPFIAGERYCTGTKTLIPFEAGRVRTLSAASSAQFVSGKLST